LKTNNCSDVIYHIVNNYKLQGKNFRRRRPPANLPEVDPPFGGSEAARRDCLSRAGIASGLYPCFYFLPQEGKI